MKSAPPATSGTSSRLPCRLLARPTLVGDSYLGLAPTLEDLKHLAVWPGTGYHPGPSRASRISAALDVLVHVAKPVCYGRSYADTHSPSGEPQSPRGLCLEISGGRSQKSPLTRSAEFFAVRHRLPEHLLASPPTRLVGPFTVELFTFGGFYGSRIGATDTRVPTSDPARRVAAVEAPCASQVERTRLAASPNPLDGIRPPRCEEGSPALQQHGRRSSHVKHTHDNLRFFSVALLPDRPWSATSDRTPGLALSKCRED